MVKTGTRQKRCPECAKAARRETDRIRKATPEAKAARKERDATPEAKAAKKKRNATYNARPEAKAAKKERDARPEAKAAKKKRDAAIAASPKGKASQKERNARYHGSPKGKATLANNRHKRRARINGNGVNMTPGALEWLKKKKEQRRVTCHYCETRGPGNSLTQDHVIAVARGGTHDGCNLAIACRPCNCSKGARSLAEWVPPTGQYQMQLQ